MSRPSSPTGRPIFLGTQFQHHFTVRFLHHFELRLVRLADVFRLSLQGVFHPDFGLVNPGLDLRRRKIELTEQLANTGRPLYNSQNQSATSDVPFSA